MEQGGPRPGLLDKLYPHDGQVGAQGRNGRKTVYAQFKDRDDALSAEVQGSILLFENGDFADGLNTWVVGQNPLPVTSVTSVEGAATAVLLGKTDYPCYGIPLGFASVAQQLLVPTSTVTLTFDYIMYTRTLASPSRTIALRSTLATILSTTILSSPMAARYAGLDCSVLRRVPGPVNCAMALPRAGAEAEVSLADYQGQL